MYFKRGENFPAIKKLIKATLLYTAVFCLLVLCLFIAGIQFNLKEALAANDAAVFNGKGTESEPFLISTARDLDNVRNFLYNKDVYVEGDPATLAGYYFKLTNDIDLKDYIEENYGEENGESGWLPIAHEALDGNYADTAFPFTGNFDGGGHTISGLYSNRASAALFGNVNADICNLNIVLDEKGNIGKEHAAGLAAVVNGSDIGRSVISNCSVTGNVSLKESAVTYYPYFNYLGGIAGKAALTEFKECFYFGTLSDISPGGSENHIGGITGQTETCAITDCYVRASLILESAADESALTSWAAGGMVGGGMNALTIKNSYVFINSAQKIGAIIGSEDFMPGSSPLTVVPSGVYYNDGIIINPDSFKHDGFKALSEKNMKKASSFDGFDFVKIWGIDERNDLPGLRYFKTFPKRLPLWAVIAIPVCSVAVLSVFLFALYWFALKKRSFKALGAALAKPFIKTVVKTETIIQKETVVIEKDKPDIPLPDTLTNREKEVAIALLSGKKRQDVCEELYIAENTLKIHIARIYEKTGCATRAELIAKYRINNSETAENTAENKS